MNASASGGTARALNSRRRPKGLQFFAILLACLGFYCLFTNVNPGLLRLYSTTVDEAKTNSATNNEPSYYPTYEPSYFPTNSPVSKTYQTNSMITCDMEKGVGSCVDPVGVEGEWVLLEPEQVLAAPVCCEWSMRKFLENQDQCGTERLQRKDGDRHFLNPFRGNINCYTQTAACFCSNFTERYVWQSPNLLPHSEFDPIDTCRLLGDREVLFIGDSTSFQAASTLMNTLYAGECQDKIIAAGSDTLVGLSHDRGEPWKAWVEKFDGPDLSLYPWVHTCPTPFHLLMLRMKRFVKK